MGSKVKVHQISASLEEKTEYYKCCRRVARHVVCRTWYLLKLASSMSCSGKQPILPLLDGSPDAASRSPLAPYITGSEPSQDSSDALASILDPNGPWHLTAELDLSVHKGRCNISTNHKRSGIAVHHRLRIILCVELGEEAPEGQEKGPTEIVIDAPVILYHPSTADDWTRLPDYPCEGPLEPAAPSDTDPGVSNSRTPLGGMLGRALPPRFIRALDPNCGVASCTCACDHPQRQVTQRWLALSEVVSEAGDETWLETMNQEGDDVAASAEVVSSFTGASAPPSYQTAAALTAAGSTASGA